MSDECSLPDPRMDETNGMAPTHEVLEAAGTQPLETAQAWQLAPYSLSTPEWAWYGPRAVDSLRAWRLASGGIVRREQIA
jgi:hypothetical protein